VLAILACIVLTAVAVADELMPADRAIARALQDTPGGRFLEPVADFIALKPVEYGLLVLAAFVAVRSRNIALAVAFVFVVLVVPLNAAFKEAISRDRPTAADLVIREPAGGYGYPSGHTMSAVLLYGYALVVALQCLPRRAGLCVAVAAGGAIALIGWDRVWDGAHWPSDVAGGALISVLLLTAAIWLPRVIRQTASRKPRQHEIEPGAELAASA
jgi:undecaprenyl-diphosphatase